MWSVFDSSKSHHTLLISGKNCSRNFSLEPGIHRVQRVPPTETKGRRQTSTIAVAVMPIDEYSDLTINPKDVIIETMRGQGPGGQHRNKTDSAVRATHKPTGITAYSATKSQHQNRVLVMNVLQMRIKQKSLDSYNSNRNDIRKEQIGNMGRGSRVRTYNFIEGRTKDESTQKNYRTKKIMSGGLDEIYKNIEP